MEFQIDPVKLAEEIAKQIDKPTGQDETIIFGLFALAGWLVASGLVWWWWRKDKERLALEMKRSETDAVERQADKDFLERSISAMVEASTAMKTQADAIKELTGKVDVIHQDMIVLKSKCSDK